MANELATTIDIFLGQKDDSDPKQTPLGYMQSIVNYGYPEKGIKGLSKILFPSVVNTIGSAAIDGLYEYRFLDSNSVLQSEEIAVTNGTVYKGAITTETAIKSGLTVGKCSFVAFNDNLFIVNGKNYPQVYYGQYGIISEMGAPLAVATATAGNPNGTYYYAMTYVTDGGEEVIGSVSNTVTVSSKQITLHLPIGYEGTTERKIYRTANGGSDLKYLATISDNTTLTYTDNSADASLIGDIPAINNELPKPYFITVANQKLYAGKVDKYPTQIFITTTNNQVFDAAVGLDISNYGDDNTPVSAIAYDFNKVVCGTARNLIFIDPITGDVVRTRGYVGIKDGYSCQILPSFGDFPGGLFFVSTQGDVRLLEGNQAAAVFQTIDNLRTDSWSQDIRGSLYNALLSYSNICSAFHNNKYELSIDGTTFIFDIRVKGWTTKVVKSNNNANFSNPRVFAIINNKLYNGQNNGTIELEYQSIQYKSKDVTASLASPFIEASAVYKFLKKIEFWYTASADCTFTATMTLDENSDFAESGSISVTGGAFDADIFDSTYFETDDSTMDYRVFNVYNPNRWAKFLFTCAVGNMTLQKLVFRGTPLSNSEKGAA